MSRCEVTRPLPHTFAHAMALLALVRGTEEDDDEEDDQRRGGPTGQRQKRLGTVGLSGLRHTVRSKTDC